MKLYDKSTQETCGLQLCRYFHPLAVVASQIFEILRKFELIAVQGHPRSLIIVSVESAYATSY